MPWPPKDGAPWDRSGHSPKGARPVGPSVHGDHPIDRTPEGELLRRLLVVLDKHSIADFDCPDSLDALLTKRLGELDEIERLRGQVADLEGVARVQAQVIASHHEKLVNRLADRDTNPEKSDGGPSYEAAVQKVLEKGCDVLGDRAVAVAADPAGTYTPPSKTARRFVQTESGQEFKVPRFDAVAALLMYYLEHTDPDDVRDSAGTMRALLEAMAKREAS